MTDIKTSLIEEIEALKDDDKCFGKTEVIDSIIEIIRNHQPAQIQAIIGTLEPIAEGNWRVKKAIGMLEALALAVTESGLPNPTPETPRRESLVERMETLKQPIVKHRKVAWNNSIDACIAIIRTFEAELLAAIEGEKYSGVPTQSVGDAFNRALDKAKSIISAMMGWKV